MSNSNTMRSMTCIAALLIGTSAQADVTAAQVWNDWKAQLQLYGEDNIAIGSEETVGGTVTVRDLALSIDDGLTQVDAELGDLVFTELGDGTVRVDIAESYPLTVTGEDGVIINMLVSQSGFDMIISGDADEMTYDISVDQYQIALEDVVDGDFTFTGDVSATANNMAITYVTSTDMLRDLSYAFAVEWLDILVDVDVPGDDGGYIAASGQINDIAAQFDMSIPLDADFENPDDLIANGFALDGGYTIANGSYVFDIDAEGDQASGSLTTGSASLDATLNADTVSYQSRTTDLAMTAILSDFPMPIDVALAEYGLGFEMPVSETDAPAPFGLRLDLIDLSISDAIWNLFDQGQVLPREPATIQLDIDGFASPKFDLMDPEQAEEIDGADLPVELDSMSLNTLRIALAGALLTGSGAFTFDNTDLETFDGMPRPEGDALFEVTGLNGLLDNLVTMGLVPQDQIMGGRMMMGMFARSTGDDRLETQIEINGEGQLFVNGQRLR